MPKNTDDQNDVKQALAHSPGYLLVTASRKLREQNGEALAPLGLSVYDYVVLRLVKLNVNLSQGSLGDTYGIDAATMVSIIDRLEARQLLSRERDQEDRRRYLLRLTPKGSKVLSRAMTIVTKSQNKFLSPLNEQEWETMRRGLCKLLHLDETKSATDQ